MDTPDYSYPLHLAPALLANVLLGGQRSFRRDSLACIANLRPPLLVRGAENIAPAGPVLITFNHYYRPGFNAWWMALALSATMPVDIHYVMTNELTFPGKWYAPLGKAGSRWLLNRFALIYGFTSMPPMPPRPGDVVVRAHSVRQALTFARTHPKATLALAPEGGDQPGGVLNWPPSGAGRFILLLAGQGFSILPVGIYEESGRFSLQFGKAYSLRVPVGLSADQKDQAAARIVMGAIARQLPARLRGEFIEAPGETDPSRVSV